MKQTRKRIGSLLITVCMVLTMLPTVAFAEEGDLDSGGPSSAREITAFADLAEDVALQEVASGTTEGELNLPDTLTVTVTGAAITGTVGGEAAITDSEEQTTKTQQEEMTVDVSDWTSNPEYNLDYEEAGGNIYTFTPTLDLPEDTTLADGVTLPQITVTVKAAVAPTLRGAELQPLGTDDTVWDGTITEVIPVGDVYYVGNGAELAWIAQQVNENNSFLGKTIKLTGDIVLNKSAENYESWDNAPPENTWIPIGYYVNLDLNYDRPFLGTFDGQNHTISGVYINTDKTDYKGLFGYTIEPSVIQNVGVIDSYIQGKNYVGGVVGYNSSGTISNCYNEGVISGNYSVGGITAGNSGTIVDCYNTGTVSATGNAVGGICSGNYRGTISDCYNTGTVSGNSDVGGITGGNYSPAGENDTGSVVTKCFNTGTVSGTGDYVGGVVGKNSTFMLPKAFIQYCYNTGTVSGKDYVGGILGSNGENSSILDCYNTGTVSGTSYVGGCYGASSSYNNNCFYLVPNKDEDPSKAEKLSEEMKTSQFVYGLNRVDYGGVNAFILPPSGTVNNGYPILTSSAKAPIFATNLSGEASYYSKDETTTALSVLANVSDSGTISYQWYKNSENNTTSGKIINGETNDTCTPPTDTEGTVYYYVIATNTNNSANGTKTATTTSKIKNVTTNEKNVNAEIPMFNTDLSGIITYTKDATATALTVSAITSDGGTISYQWYENSKNNTTSGTKIYKETKDTYTPPTAIVGTVYYYVIATNRNDSANGVKTATARSKIKTVTINADTYAVTVNSGTASLSTAAAGAEITITADSAPSGKQFKEWTVDSGGVTLANSKATSTTFTMPANAVEVTATYEDIPDGVTLVTGVTLNKNSLSLYSNTSTKTANLTATITPTDATDQSVTWQSSNMAVATVDASGKVTAVGNGTANIIVTTTDGGYTASCTVTVSTYTSGGGSSSGGGSGGGSSSVGDTTKTTITKGNQPNQPITAVASVTATAETNGTASASISDKAVTDAIAKAQTELKKQGKTENGIAVGLNVTMPKGATTLTATLPQNALNSLVSAGVTNLEINGAPIILTFDQKVLTEIQKQSSGNVNIAIAPQAELSKMAKALIGTRPVYNITVGYGDNRTVSNFGGGVATVGIPYTPANGEAIGGLYAVYVDENGNATRVAGSSYDANSGCIIFTTTHFSMYGVGYSAPSAEFADINSHWAKESIDYVVGKGLLSGTSETTFAPNTAMTRGMLVTALGRLEGVDVSSYTKNSFTDVKAGSAFKPYIEWAYEKGIIQGIGNNKFAPDRAITREEIAVIVANFTKATGYTLPVKSEATTYADDSSISSTYKTAVTAMQQAGIMMGGTSNKFNPKSNATRAEVSSMLYRYMKLNME